MALKDVASQQMPPTEQRRARKELYARCWPHPLDKRRPNISAALLHVCAHTCTKSSVLDKIINVRDLVSGTMTMSCPMATRLSCGMPLTACSVVRNRNNFAKPMRRIGLANKNIPLSLLMSEVVCNRRAGSDSLAMAVTAIKGLPPQQQLVLVAAVRLLGDKPTDTQPQIGSPPPHAGTPSALRPPGQLQPAVTPSTSARKPPIVSLCRPCSIWSDHTMQAIADCTLGLQAKASLALPGLIGIASTACWLVSQKVGMQEW